MLTENPPVANEPRSHLNLLNRKSTSNRIPRVKNIFFIDNSSIALN